MTDSELRRLAHYIVQEQANNEQWLTAFAKAQAKLREPEKRLVGAKKAAEMLGISVTLLRRIKDDENGVPQFSYVKGGSKSSPLKFFAEIEVDISNLLNSSVPSYGRVYFIFSSTWNERCEALVEP
jgi:hypothetical protein